MQTDPLPGPTLPTPDVDMEGCVPPFTPPSIGVYTSRGLSGTLRWSEETKADDKGAGALKKSSARDGSLLQGSIP
jgi:hypothetical protein